MNQCIDISYLFIKEIRHSVTNVIHCVMNRDTMFQLQIIWATIPNKTTTPYHQSISNRLEEKIKRNDVNK